MDFPPGPAMPVSSVSIFLPENGGAAARGWTGKAESQAFRLDSRFINRALLGQQ